jgi:hypothetical protein
MLRRAVVMFVGCDDGRIYCLFGVWIFWLLLSGYESLSIIICKEVAILWCQKIWNVSFFLKFTGGKSHEKPNLLVNLKSL